MFSLHGGDVSSYMSYLSRVRWGGPGLFYCKPLMKRNTQLHTFSMFPHTCLTYLGWDEVDLGSFIVNLVWKEIHTVLYTFSMLPQTFQTYLWWDEVDLTSCILNLLWKDKQSLTYLDWDGVDLGSFIVNLLWKEIHAVIYVLNVSSIISNISWWDEVDLGSCI